MLGAILGAVSVVSGIMAQQSAASAAKRQAADQERAFRANLENQLSQSNLMESQMIAQTNQAIDARALATLRERGALRAQAMDANIAGGGVQRLQALSELTKGFDIGTIEKNQSMKLAQLELERQGLKAGTQSKINQVQSQADALKMNPLDYATGALKIAGGFYEAGAFDNMFKQSSSGLNGFNIPDQTNTGGFNPFTQQSTLF